MDKMPEIIVIAHNIRSVHNVGSIFRTCEGFGVSKLIISGYSPYPDLSLSQDELHRVYSETVKPQDLRLPHIREKITNQIHKTALGAESLVPFEYYETLDVWLRYNHERDNIPIIALEQNDASIPLRGYTPPMKFALLLGEEVHGIEQQYLKYCQDIVEIPMHGKKESFNVSVATGIALYALST